MDLQEALAQIEQLKRGLESRGRVGIAIGIVMSRFDIDEHVAFDYLVRQSQHANIKLALVAEEVIRAQKDPSFSSGGAEGVS